MASVSVMVFCVLCLYWAVELGWGERRVSSMGFCMNGYDRNKGFFFWFGRVRWMLGPIVLASGVVAPVDAWMNRSRLSRKIL